MFKNALKKVITKSFSRNVVIQAMPDENKLVSWKPWRPVLLELAN